jgi:hypothetical protein
MPARGGAAAAAPEAMPGPVGELAGADPDGAEVLELVFAAGR